jgi:hypothetical protein
MASSIKIAGASALFAFLILFFSFHDSPVDAGSGSIYSTIRWFHYFHEQAASAIYRTKPDNNDIITTTGLQNPPPLLTGTGGWTIIFAGRDSSKNPKYDVARLCSNVNCDNQGLDPDGWVYLKITDPHNAQWQTKWWSRWLYYHDISKGCEAVSGQQDGPCDYLTSMTITTLGRGSYEKIPCADRTCLVTIGGAKAQKRLKER